jgi:XTP/dITP diphosphohydrolase
MRLVFATNNAHKLQEARAMLEPQRQVLSLAEIGCNEQIEENGTTLEANSLLKAQYVYEHYGISCFADDTGLEIEALDGAPGVYTARWAGEPSCDVNNRKKALTELANVENRNAQFRTVITLITQDFSTQVEGIVKGTIATEEKGTNGFGYDPVFVPEGYSQTFAELPSDVKNTMSHRANAIKKLKEVLINL